MIQSSWPLLIAPLLVFYAAFLCWERAIVEIESDLKGTGKEAAREKEKNHFTLKVKKRNKLIRIRAEYKATAIKSNLYLFNKMNFFLSKKIQKKIAILVNEIENGHFIASRRWPRLHI